MFTSPIHTALKQFVLQLIPRRNFRSSNASAKRCSSLLSHLYKDFGEVHAMKDVVDLREVAGIEQGDGLQLPAGIGAVASRHWKRHEVLETKFQLS